MADIIADRRKYSVKQLDQLIDRIKDSKILERLPNLCIYATGSYGRLEASQHSDIDLFFINKGSSEGAGSIGRINKTLLDAELIKTVDELGYPAFSNDGEYLTVHYLEDVKRTLGSREDDFENHFTARLLLLLESRCLHNNEIYEHSLDDLLREYFRDYSEHRETFQPLFLLNDILRFWRTLCLNYEHRRRNVQGEATDHSDYRKHKDRLLNLKLIFVRLLTCHSAVAMLCLNGKSTDLAGAKEIVALSPLDRLDKIGQIDASLSNDITALKKSYEWFLCKTGHEKERVLRWIGQDSNWQEARDQRRHFAKKMYKLIRKTSRNSGIRKFLVV